MTLAERFDSRGVGGGTEIERLPVALDDRSYDILIGPRLLAETGMHVRDALYAGRAGPPAAIVTDENVAELYLDAVKESLAASGLSCRIEILPPGEETKCFASLQMLCERLLDAGLERSSALIALGGGVIGDLTGFAAAVLLRGVRYVQIPTTLLAQVDSSVGGKTAINVPQGKNLVGAFHQPALVLADTDVLDSLPERELLAGYAEVVKYGLIDDPAFFSWLEAEGKGLIAGDPALRRTAIRTSCASKAAIVGADEREQGDRAPAQPWPHLCARNRG